MIQTAKLISFHIIEREHSQNFLTWTYPTITENLAKFITNRTFTDTKKFKILRQNSNWIYIKENQDSSCKKFAIITITSDFEPKKYKQLCDILEKKYAKSQNPVELVKLYLNLFTLGSCSFQENGNQILCDFKNFKPDVDLRKFIKSFGLEIILIYTAILLKRRILIYGDCNDELFNELVDIIRLVPLRNYEDYLYPLLNNTRELRGLSFYVAGTNNIDLIKEENLYDLFINLETREITISSKSEAIMTMTKTHKEIATFLVKLSESDLSQVAVEEEIAKKTSDVISLLKNLGSVSAGNLKLITADDLKKRKYHPALENFLFNLAIAENLMML